MTHEEAKRVHPVVVGIDYSEVSDVGLLEAVRWAQHREPSHIHVVYVPPAAPTAQALGLADPAGALEASVAASAERLNEETSQQVQAHVQKIASSLELAPNAQINWTVHLRAGDAAQAICQLASDVEAELIVVGTHGRTGLARFLLGSVAEGVVRLAPCAVLVARAVGAQAAATSPAIEPACPQCLRVRRESQGQQFWCERHAEHHGRPHTYHFSPFRDSRQSGLLIHPT